MDGRERVYLTAETHSSVAKSARVAGLGARALHVVDPSPGRLRHVARTRWPRRWPRTSRPGCDRPWSARRSAAPGPAPSTGCASSPRSRREHARVGARGRRLGRGGGALPRAPGAAGRGGAGRLVLHRRAQVAAHRVRRVAAVGARRAGAAGRACRSPRSTCATRPASPGRWWTTGTGRCRSAAGSGRSSCGRWSTAYGLSGLRAHIRVARRAWPTSWPTGSAPTRGSRSPVPPSLALVCLRLVTGARPGRRRRRHPRAC